MRTQKELVASLHERMAARERARAHRRVQALRAAAVAVAACLLLVIYGGGVARQGGTRRLRGARVKGVVFRNIRIEESKNLISLWINKAVWSSGSERGHIEDVRFENILADGVINPTVELLGYDADHQVENVSLDRITVNGVPFNEKYLKINKFVKNIQINQQQK